MFQPDGSYVVRMDFKNPTKNMKRFAMKTSDGKPPVGDQYLSNDLYAGLGFPGAIEVTIRPIDVTS